jgi:hypothetical protein
MALVGDAIMSVRAAIPDRPRTLNPPANLSAAAANVATGSLSGNFYVIATATNPWGETLTTSEVGPITVSGGNNAITGSVVLPPGGTAGRAYYTQAGGGAGSECQFVPIAANGTFTILGAGQPGFVPQASSAWNPDTDGNYISASLIYKWLNDGLTFIAGAAGGIEDTTGIASIAQQLYYQIPGRWIRFNTARWDQWPVVLADRDYIQYRYNVSGVVSIIATEALTAQLGTVFSSFPEPGSSSATTTLTAPMGTSDLSLSCVDASAFTPMSRIQIDNEILMFSQVNSTTPGFINGLIRGAAGTVPAIHALGATITELKFNFSGFRYPRLYSPGSAYLDVDASPVMNLDIRDGWEVALNWYMLARAKEKEQAMDEADKLDGKFANYVKELQKKQANPIAVSQIGGTLDRGRDVGRGRIIVP